MKIKYKRTWKSVLLLIAAMAFGGTLYGQQLDLSEFSSYGSKEKKAPVKGEPQEYPRLRLGFQLGANYSTMKYTSQDMDYYAHKGLWSFNYGAFLYIPLGNEYWALRPGIVSVGRGDRMTFEDIDYRLKARYVNLRLPLIYRLPTGRHFGPYLLLAPYFEWATSGELSYSDKTLPNNISISATDGNLARHDAGLLFGGGVEWRLDLNSMPLYFTFEANYHWGMVNSFSDLEKKGTYTGGNATIVNNFLGARLWDGERYHRGWEFAVQVAFPMDGKFVKQYRDARNGSPVEESPQVVIPPAGKDTVVLLIKDTVYLKEAQPSNPGDYETKECFSIREIHQMIDRGVNISNKRICIYNLNFDFDSYDLSDDSLDKLLDLLILMRAYPEMTIAVFGHTDSRGTEEYNQVLSEKRAQSVADYLIKRGISPMRILTFGYGKMHPIAREDSEYGCMLNRRVEIEVIRIGKKRHNNY